MLEEEVYGNDSPIWDPEFKPTPGSNPMAAATTEPEPAEASEPGMWWCSYNINFFYKNIFFDLFLFSYLSD